MAGKFAALAIQDDVEKYFAPTALGWRVFRLSGPMAHPAVAGAEHSALLRLEPDFFKSHPALAVRDLGRKLRLVGSVNPV